MGQSFETKSLLPWLDQGAAKIYLDISIQGKSLGNQADNSLPFLFIHTSSPLFLLVHATYRSPSGKRVKDVFLLVQKDSCSFSDNHSRFTNTEIEKIWQEACACQESAPGIDSFDSLTERSDDRTSLPLWQSLFYCDKRELYFHPPCPQCGNDLELCQRDEILSNAGLPLYSTTGERFLFCPVCHGSPSGTDFFVLEGGSGFPANVKDCRALVQGFEQFVGKGLQGHAFPCFDCSEQKECYGSGFFASRISPFAFYPFRMFVSDAGQLSAEDFLAILSGASCSEIIHLPQVMRDPGRVACIEAFAEQVSGESTPLFFENDARDFLELFYLKTTLLEQIARTVFSVRRHLKHVDLRLCLDQFWVNFPDYRGLLPSFWNFRVRPLALGIFPVEGSSFIRVPESLVLQSMALIWFHCLLVNKEQSATDVQQGLALLDGSTNQLEVPDFLSCTVHERNIFAPENIFWIPSQKKVNPQWLVLWNKALGLGWSLLQACFGRGSFSEEETLNGITDLANELKKILFAATRESFVEQSPAVMEKRDDSEIMGILVGIREKWLAEAEAAKEQAVVQDADQMPEQTEPAQGVTEDLSHGEELEKTVILSADQLAAMMKQQEQTDRKDEAQEKSVHSGVSDVREEPDLEKTVILNTDRLAAMTGEQVSPVPQGEAQEKSIQPDVNEGEDEPELEKTVIMNLNDLSSLLPEEKQAPADPGAETAPASPPEPQPNVPVDDELCETVIINPEELQKLRKLKNGNK
ncbi:MAG: hypothetical protein KQH63_08030 [Desulfobulbaceae bacterium]|nr:hypothetical protein [Desulfobulbaceae bacterium]